MEPGANYYPSVAKLEPLSGMRLRLVFTDGSEGIADLSDVPRKRPHDCPWKTQNDFRRVYLSHGTAVWDSGGESVDYSPTDLYVRAGFADWEEILADPDPDKIVVEFVRDCRGDRIFARSSTGKEGHLKVSPAMFSGAQYTLPDSPQGKTVIAPWGDVLWRNKHEIEAEVIDRHLSAKAA